ncbi:MAG: MBL fold metallo-hydrolase [Porticoccaceae bacterium]|nr:MBL fold metallo-hydrolase [Porticoccaceae bacterium]
MTTEEVDVRRFSAKESSTRVGRIPTPSGFPGLGDINSYLIFPEDNSDELILIDTGVRSDEAWQSLNDGLKQLDYHVEDITKIILTHGHTDHYGQAHRIHKASGCELWAHENLWMTVERMQPPPDRLEKELYFYSLWGVDQELVDKALARRAGFASTYEAMEPTHLLKDGEQIDIPGFNLETVHTPGHCPDEVIYWQAESKVIFSGDHLLPHITPVCLLQIPYGEEARPPSLIQYQASLAKVAPYPARVTYPSHGEPILDHCDLINSYNLSTDRRLLKISRILEKGGWMNPMEIAKELFPKAWQEQMVPVMSEILGHCDILEAGGHVAMEEKAGLIRYRYISTPPPS